jgi:hypothetical protein
MIGNFIGSVRRNHALEHATVSLLIAKLGPDLRLVGRATGDGFYIYGDNIPTDTLAECAHEGLARLKRGEAFWAVTPLCGTNLATAGILAGLSSLATIGTGNRRDRLPTVMMAGIFAVIVAQPLGRIVQRHVTTSPDLANTEIVGIDVRRNGVIHKVQTRRAPTPALAT